MKIPLSKPYLDAKEERAVVPVLRSGWIMQGKVVEQFEKKLAGYIGVSHALAVSSGTAALHLALLALGIGPGDEVLVPSLSFIASANCILYVGAKPVFVEVDERTYNIDPLDTERKITSKTRAIIVVHQLGLPADIERFEEVTKKHKLLLIEDAACALGSTYQGKNIGTFGDVACFSFHPRKSITTGEGGLLATKSDKLSQKLKSLRSHGVIKDASGEHYPNLGYNYRMTDLQAAIGLMQFKKLEVILKRRKVLAGRYDLALKTIPGIITAHVPEGVTHTYQSYVIRFTSEKIRNRIAKFLAQKGIATKGMMMIHHEPLYKKLFGTIHLLVTEQIVKDALILPLYTQMTKKDQDYVIQSIKGGMGL